MRWIIFILMVIPLKVSAGWFGADNYNECVLEKMERQPSGVLGYARNVCRDEFPLKKAVRKEVVCTPSLEKPNSSDNPVFKQFDQFKEGYSMPDPVDCVEE